LSELNGLPHAAAKATEAATAAPRHSGHAAELLGRADEVIE